MSHSNLQQLLAGELTSQYRVSKGLEPISRLQVSANLDTVPQEVFALADSLEILDLSNNAISDLPDEMVNLIHMKILFLSNNHFEHVPAILARCPKLEMISFKSNELMNVDEDVLPLDTRWLILTDNKITKLPDSMGKLRRLQKLALAGNKLVELPASMADCHNLELARLSANELTAMPDWLFQLPKLSWLAFSGNAFNRYDDSISAVTNAVKSNDRRQTIEAVALNNIELGELIGEGASGYIYRAQWKQQPDALIGTDSDIAVKIFKGSVTSDGFPQDELDCCLTAGEHSNLIKVVAQLDQTDENKKLGLVMELISSEYSNLGLPPSLKTCTRDTFAPGTSFCLNSIAKIVSEIASTLQSLHGKGISHGDVYAHNTMINEQANVLLGDFGAATNLYTLPPLQSHAMENIEVRALGCLLDDLLSLEILEQQDGLHAERFSKLRLIADQCLQHNVLSRPSFAELNERVRKTIQ